VVDVDFQAKRVSSQAGIDLQRLVSDTAATALPRLPHRGQVRIRVRVNPEKVVASGGVGGDVDHVNGNVAVWFDDTPSGGLRTALKIWLPVSLAHELHHSSRIRTGPGYGRTLGEAMVSEGLAE
jgi:hypothetical protein